MNLQQTVVQCNENIAIQSPDLEIQALNYSLALEGANNNNVKSAVVTAMLHDIIGREFPTNIALDNVLVFGSNVDWNQDIANHLQSAFAHFGKVAQIIDVATFFSIPVIERRKSGVLYIIKCDTHISTKKLSVLREQTGTQILFKISGLNWKHGSSGVDLKTRAQQVLSALGIYDIDSIGIRLLASLGPKEFCVNNDRNICKRTL